MMIGIGSFLAISPLYDTYAYDSVCFSYDLCWVTSFVRIFG